MGFWLPALITVVSCLTFNFLYFRLFVDGTLRIDHSNPEKDVYRFDIDDLDSLCKKKRIIIRVDNRADLSQK